MPTIFVWRGHGFFFYSAEGSEPAHVHVRKASNECKIWLHDAALAYNYGYRPVELAAVIRHVKAHCEELQEAWRDHFGD